MLISATVRSNVLALLLSLAVVYGPMMIVDYLPFGMQKARNQELVKEVEGLIFFPS